MEGEPFRADALVSPLAPSAPWEDSRSKAIPKGNVSVNVVAVLLSFTSSSSRPRLAHRPPVLIMRTGWRKGEMKSLVLASLLKSFRTIPCRCQKAAAPPPDADPGLPSSPNLEAPWSSPGGDECWRSRHGAPPGGHLACLLTGGRIAADWGPAEARGFASAVDAMFPTGGMARSALTTHGLDVAHALELARRSVAKRGQGEHVMVAPEGEIQIGRCRAIAAQHGIAPSRGQIIHPSSSHPLKLGLDRSVTHSLAKQSHI